MKLLREAYHSMCGFAGGELDLRSIAPGLIAFTGPNFNGKTTLLELPLAAFYREWGSRETKDISKWADARDSWVECDVELNGSVYRARVNIDGTTRKAQAVLSLQTPQGWQALTDGKVSTFDAAMGQLVPPKDALLCSQFATQNRAGSLTGASRAQRKDLFIHFLWLDHVIAMADTAKVCAQVADTTSMVLRSKIEGLERESSAELEGLLLEQRDAAEAQLALLLEQSETLASAIERAERERETLVEAVAEYLAAAADVVRATGMKAVAERTLLELPARVDRLHAQATADMASSVQRVDRGLATIDSRIAELNALLETAESVRAAASECDALKVEIEALRTAQAESVELKSALDGQIRDAQAAATVSQVPCGGISPYSTCGFLKSALAAQSRLEGRTEVELRAALKTLVEEHTARLRSLEERQTRLKALLPTAKRLADVQVAADRLEEQQIQREELIGTESERVELVKQRLEAGLDELKTQRDTVSLDLSEADSILAAAQPVMARTEGAKGRVAVLDGELASSRAGWTEIERRRATATVTREERATALAGLYERRTRVEALYPRLQQVEDDMRIQSLLMRAFHRDGLPTLEIAAAAPAISQLTTDLLEHSGFGSRFRVDVTTLVPTADGKDWKEDFAVRVWDNDRVKEILDIGDLSGGERILVEEALRAALTIYMSSRHTHRIRTCWRDETTGPLDAENRTRYIAMLRRLRELGQYDHVLFVSHADDAIEAADTIVDVRMGAATVRRVA